MVTNQTVTKPRIGLASIVGAGSIGTLMEWYIFFIFTTGALYIERSFFPKSNPALGLIYVFLVYAIGFFFRPVGGFIFGHLGDRTGRNSTLVVTILVAGLSGGLIGVLPTYAQFGWGAVALLVILRAISGISLGGEWGGAMILGLENIKKRKGFYAAFVQSTVGIGLILGSLAFLLTTKSVGSVAMYNFGWRIPFLLSFVILAVGLYLRLRIPDTPMFSAVKKENKVLRNPIGQVFRKYPKELILGIFISGVGAFFSFGVSFYTVILEANKIIPLTLGFTGLIIAGLTQTIVTFLSGAITDRIGRKPTVIISAVMFLVIAFPAFVFMSVTSFYIYSFLFPFSMALGYAPNGAIVSEIFPTNIRYSGSSLTYQIGNAYLTGPTALLSKIFYVFNPLLAPLWGVFISIGMIVAVIVLPETKDVDLETVVKVTKTVPK